MLLQFQSTEPLALMISFQNPRILNGQGQLSVGVTHVLPVLMECTGTSRLGRLITLNSQEAYVEHSCSRVRTYIASSMNERYDRITWNSMSR